MPRVLTDKGVDMLDMYPPLVRNSYDVLAFVDAMAREVERLDAAQEEIVDGGFLLRSVDPHLAHWERVLGLAEAPIELNLTERQQRASVTYRQIRKHTSGEDFISRLDDIMGQAWSYVNAHPNGWRGMWYDLCETIPTTPPWTFLSGNAGNIEIDDGAWQILSASVTPVWMRYDQEQHADQMVIMEFVAGSNPATSAIVVQPKSLPNTKHIEIYAGWANTLAIQRWNGSTYAAIGSGASYTLTPGTRYWLVGKVSGNSVTGEIWTQDPTKGSGSAAASCTGTIAAPDQASLGTGVLGYQGARFLIDDSWRIESLRGIETGFSIPDHTLRVTIPYDADTGRAYEIEQMLRKLTPANMALQVFYDTGFLLGISHLGTEGLS